MGLIDDIRRGVTYNRVMKGIVIYDAGKSLVVSAGGFVYRKVGWIGPKPSVGSEVYIDLTMRPPVAYSVSDSMSTAATTASTLSEPVTSSAINVAQVPGDMQRSVYDTNNNNIVDAAESVPWSGVTGKPSVFPPETHNHDTLYYRKNETYTKTEIENIVSSVGGTSGVYWYVDGVLEQASDVYIYVVPRDIVIRRVYVAVGDKGTAGQTTVDILRNGSSIFISQQNKPTIPYDASSNVVSVVPNVTSLSENDIITLNIESAAANAANLAVIIDTSTASQQLMTSLVYKIIDPYPNNRLDTSLFSWVNKGSATFTVDQATGFVHMHTPAASGSNLRMLVKSAPQTPFIVRVGFIPYLNNAANNNFYLCVYDSSSSRVKRIAVISRGSGTNDIIADKFNSPTSFNSSYSGVWAMSLTAHVVHLAISDDGTNMSYMYSLDGVFYKTIITTSRNDFTSYNMVGIGLESANSTYGCAATIIYYREEPL